MGEHSSLIESEPTGAQEPAAGAETGTSPTRIYPEQVFPPRLVNFTYRADGTPGIEHPGCAPCATRVDDKLLSKDVRVELDCDPAAGQPAVPSPPTASSSAWSSWTNGGHEVLSEDEYAAPRRRTLNHP